MTMQRGPENGCVDRGAQVAALRTEAQRMAVWDDYAERPRGRLCRQRGLEDGCEGRQRGPEAEIACCMQTCSE